MKIITTEEAPLPLGHYSQAVAHNGTLYISGQLPVDPRNPDKPVGSIEEQTKQTLKNIEALLLAADTSKENVLKVTIYISDIALWGRVNTVYAEYFGKNKPARAAVPTRDLPKGYQIEIEAVAAL
ncbi:MAG: RidA family protein [bacterium]|nr:RidA family protein [bacterium]